MKFLIRIQFFIFFYSPFSTASPDSRLQDFEATSSMNTPKQIFRKALEKTIQLRSGGDSTDSSGASGHSNIKQMPATIKLGSPECTTISVVCSMYSSALKTLTQIKLEILGKISSFKL